MTEENVELHRGLREVYIDRTTSSYIDGKEGKLYYRGYNIDDLATNCSFEEIIYLVMMGDLPTESELTNFTTELRSNMTIPDPVSYTHRRCRRRLRCRSRWSPYH